MDAFERGLLQILADNGTTDLRAYIQSKSGGNSADDTAYTWIVQEIHDNGFISMENADDLFNGNIPVLAKITDLGRNRLIGHLNGFDGEYYHRERLIRNAADRDIPTETPIEKKDKSVKMPWSNIWAVVSIIVGIILFILGYVL